MILAETLDYMTKLGPKALARILDSSGYPMCSFESARFLGITNGGEFAYEVIYYDEGGGPVETLEPGKVFVKYDHATDSLSADF